MRQSTYLLTHLLNSTQYSDQSLVSPRASQGNESPVERPHQPAFRAFSGNEAAGSFQASHHDSNQKNTSTRTEPDHQESSFVEPIRGWYFGFESEEHSGGIESSVKEIYSGEDTLWGFECNTDNDVVMRDSTPGVETTPELTHELYASFQTGTEFNDLSALTVSDLRQYLAA